MRGGAYHVDIQEMLVGSDGTLPCGDAPGNATIKCTSTRPDLPGDLEVLSDTCGCRSNTIATPTPTVHRTAGPIILPEGLEAGKTSTVQCPGGYVDSTGVTLACKHDPLKESQLVVVSVAACKIATCKYPDWFDGEKHFLSGCDILQSGSRCEADCRLPYMGKRVEVTCPENAAQLEAAPAGKKLLCDKLLVPKTEELCLNETNKLSKALREGRKYTGNVQCCDVNTDWCASFATGVVLYEQDRTCSDYYLEGGPLADRCSAAQTLLKILSDVKGITHASFWFEVIGLTFQVVTVLVFIILFGRVEVDYSAVMGALLISMAIQGAVQLTQIALESADIHLVRSSNVGDITSELINKGRCFSREGNAVLIGFKSDFETKVHVIFGELALSIAGLLLVVWEAFDAWIYARNIGSAQPDDWKDFYYNNVKLAGAQIVLAFVDTYFAYFELYQLTLPGYEEFFNMMGSIFSGENLVIEEEFTVVPCLQKA